MSIKEKEAIDVMDRETVMLWLKICGKDDDCSALCPYRLERPTCMRKLMADAFERMKEQEAVEPDQDSEGTCTCGNCGETVGLYQVGIQKPVKLCNFCPSCGKAVKWNE